MKRSSVILLCLCGLAIGVGGGTWAAFSSQTTTAAQSFSAAGSFPCTAGNSTVTADLDTYVDQQNPTTSYGTSTALEVRSLKQGANSRNKRTLVRFALPTIPAGCTLASATLTLTVNSGTTGRTLQAFRAGAAFTETTTWNTQPATAGTATTTASATTGTVSFNVLAQTTLLYSDTNTGFLVRDSVEDGGNITQAFSSREAASGKPSLAVTWN